MRKPALLARSALLIAIGCLLSCSPGGGAVEATDLGQDVSIGDEGAGMDGRELRFPEIAPNDVWTVPDTPEDIPDTSEILSDTPEILSDTPCLDSGEPDVLEVPTLCQPCSVDADCAIAGGTEEACISYGAEGAFCGCACGDDGCPAGFSCVEALTLDGDTLEQCVADSGVCACSDLSVTLGLWTPCWTENEWGTCGGVRVCTEDGLSDCDAGIPAEELCNGQDDDCDGETDEDSCAVGEICDPTFPGCVPDPALLPPLPISSGSEWRTLDDGSDQGTLWTTIAFDDSAWASGPAELGYGDGDEATELFCGPSAPACDSDNQITNYFRHGFYVPEPAAVLALDLSLLRDDGAVVYLNGAEVCRQHMPDGTILFDTLASSPATGGADESTFFPCPQPDVSLLVTGKNVVAVEVHQHDGTSSDISFDLEMVPTIAPNGAPNPPTNPQPADGAVGVAADPLLCVDVSDPESEPMTVTFYGRESVSPPEDFTVIVLPDPQNYASNPSLNELYTAQTQWCVDEREARNIVFVTGVGDMVNSAGKTEEWDVADAAFSLLEDPGAVGLADGMAYGMTVGNHDQVPFGVSSSGGDEGATTTNYNSYFGLSRFAGRAYFGDRYDFGDPGAYPENMDNHYELFSAAGMDFIIFHLETEMGAGYTGICPEGSTCRDVVQWVDDTLVDVYPNRRAIIVSHALVHPSGASFTEHGQVLYDALQDNPNVFLMLCGHLSQANHRADTSTVDGKDHTVYSLVADYQGTSNGGNGWLRILTFSPLSGDVHVETYSPTVDGGRYINKPTPHANNAPNDPCAADCYTDGNFPIGGNELLLPYDMEVDLPYQLIGTVAGVLSGGQACVPWPGQLPGVAYEWFVEVSDGAAVTTGPPWTFSTLEAAP
ncbi:MAG: hypothetical protein ABIK09_14920 [Pseudomonadota bacterium]